MRKINIVKGNTSPSKSDLWLTYNEKGQPVIKKWGSAGWELLTGDNSTEEELKEALSKLEKTIAHALVDLNDRLSKIESLTNQE